MNSSIVFPLCSILLNSATFTDFSSSPPISFLISVKNSPVILYFNNPVFKSSNMFSFQTSANLSCTYDRIYYICSSTAISLIFILIYSLHTVTKPETFNEVLSNTCSFATSVLTTTTIAISPSIPLFASAWSWAYIAVSYSYCCLIIVYKLYWLILYSSGGNSISKAGDNNGSGGIGGYNFWTKRTNPTLDSVSDLYSELDITLFIGASSTLLVYLILFTNYLYINYFSKNTG